MKNPLASSLSKSRIVTGLIAACLCVASSLGDTANTRERSTARIAEGVYFIRHPDAPDLFPQGNTTVIIGERECLVVDSCLLPSSAKEDIAQIRSQHRQRSLRADLSGRGHHRAPRNGEDDPEL